MIRLPATTLALAKDRACFPVLPVQARRRSFVPIARTPKAPGDLVLGNCVKPLELVS